MITLHTAQSLVSIKTSDGIEQPIDHHHPHTQTLGMHRLYEGPAIEFWVIAGKDYSSG